MWNALEALQSGVVPTMVVRSMAGAVSSGRERVRLPLSLTESDGHPLRVAGRCEERAASESVGNLVAFDCTMPGGNADGALLHMDAAALTHPLETLADVAILTLPHGAAHVCLGAAGRPARREKQSGSAALNTNSSDIKKSARRRTPALAKNLIQRSPSSPISPELPHSPQSERAEENDRKIADQCSSTPHAGQNVVTEGLKTNMIFTKDKAASKKAAHRAPGHPKKPLPPPSKHCHVCTRARASVTSLICRGVRTGTCRKVICITCFKNFNWDWDDAVAQGDTWACVHCNGVCPKMAQCHVYNKINERRRHNRRHAKVTADHSILGGSDPNMPVR
mmetsp:Transcript_1334/g.3657  ORF Transcript_1334/g.3657 Transcript_1334/m.3657 type:complete len:336 (-) Transcript_1334:241-1248(-)|eukprot:CAMPEP_0185836356 /NCGR_PEP_ID=MMETSP1353-20130828/9565_1 /TAXON_ID=1077150 /ORGANISM="Erythrolobus australicus, Strain CCMP3124" /LENGTH=335 /DNA_ID=CAMNT_0028535139 /DNA_START=69 /DNA_END=1076 /DNA_ORIENTATION=-